MSKHFDVVVIGGGITGNSSALALAQCGLTVALLSNEKPTPLAQTNFDARIYALSDANTQLLKHLRVWDALRVERMCAVKDMRIMGDAAHGERQQGVLHFNAYSAHQSQLAWIVEQSNMQTALLQAMQFSSNITIIDDGAIELNVQPEHVEMCTQSGRTLTADLLIGSDGAQSWVRQASNISTDVFDYAQSGVVANFACTQPHHGCAQQWFLADGAVLALLPLPEQHVSMVYSCAQATADELLNLDGKKLSEHITQLSHGVLGDLTSVSATQAFPLKRMRANRLIAARTVLIGDAAHTVHPMAGQGLNLGLQDVACLQHIIMSRPSHRAIHDTVLLRRYERERSAATLHMQVMTHGLNRLFSHAHPASQHLRNLGMNLLDIAPPLKRWLIKSAMGASHRAP